MLDKFNLEIEDFGLINEAKIEIGKINVVGGINMSGKSTASKLLYCFLKAMSINRKDYAFATILPTINSFINLTEKPSPYGSNDLPDKYTIDDKFNAILIDYLEAKDKYDKLGNYFKIREVFDDWERECDKFIKILLDENENAYSSFDRMLLDCGIKQVESSEPSDSFYRKSYSTLVKHLFEDESLLNFKGNASLYNDSFKSSAVYEPTGDSHFGMVERYLDLATKEGISSEDFDDFDDDFIYSTKGKFEFINDVFYVDSISYFDLDNYITIDNKIREVFGYKAHIEHLLNQLRDDENKPNLSEDVIEKINGVIEKITEIIGGETYRTVEDWNSLELDYYYIPEDSDKRFNIHISSGIQQISIIQILLDKHKLNPGCFLIMDEPEVNLHPEWQFKFAEILVLLAKELDITIYLNSHSPMFIEAIEVLTQYYDMEDETNFYLTEKQENDKYTFVKIEYDNLYELFDNLAKPFDIIEVYRLQNEYKRGNY